MYENLTFLLILTKIFVEVMTCNTISWHLSVKIYVLLGTYVEI